MRGNRAGALRRLAMLDRDVHALALHHVSRQPQNGGCREVRKNTLASRRVIDGEGSGEVSLDRVPLNPLIPKRIDSVRDLHPFVPAHGVVHLPIAHAFISQARSESERRADSFDPLNCRFHGDESRTIRRGRGVGFPDLWINRAD